MRADGHSEAWKARGELSIKQVLGSTSRRYNASRPSEVQPGRIAKVGFGVRGCFNVVVRGLSIETISPTS